MWGASGSRHRGLGGAHPIAPRAGVANRWVRQLSNALEKKLAFMDEKIILGIDPGSLVMGFGVIRVSKQAGTQVVAYDAIRFEKRQEPMTRMHHLYASTLELLERHAPDEVAIESIFYGKNIQSMITLGRAQGVAIAAALACAIPVSEYAPCKVKQAVTGKGTASKACVARMVGHWLGISIAPSRWDASDALAVALCHSQQQTVAATSATKTWAQFLQQNPQRVV